MKYCDTIKLTENSKKSKGSLTRPIVFFYISIQQYVYSLTKQADWSMCLISLHASETSLYFRAYIISTRQVTRATHVRNRVCPRVELILKIIIILLIIFLGFIKSKPC